MQSKRSVKHYYFRKRKQRKFIKTLKQVNKHNKNFNEGISGYLQTVNQFTVMVINILI